MPIPLPIHCPGQHAASHCDLSGALGTSPWPVPRPHPGASACPACLCRSHPCLPACRADPLVRVNARAHKMSKSRGNVINPDDVVFQYGADSLRLYEMFMGPLRDTKVGGWAAGAAAVQ